MSLQNSHQISDVKVLLKKGADGTGIADIELTGQSLNVDTYTITLTNGDKYTFTVTNGTSIASIEKTSTVGNVDTYTITLTDGSTSTFTVTNAYGATASSITCEPTPKGETDVQGALDELFDDKLDETVVAPVETSTTASQAYSSGDQFIYNGKLYEATASIASGGTITIGTNCKLASTLVEQMKHGFYELWKGSSSASFAGQTVTINDIDTSKIDRIDLEMELWASELMGSQTWSFDLDVLDNTTKYLSYYFTGDGKQNMLQRTATFTITSTSISIVFSDAFRRTWNTYGSNVGTDTPNNTHMIPYRILGLIHND